MPNFQNTGSPWLLKGGYATELRIQAARATRDIDLALPLSLREPAECDAEFVAANLREAAAINLNSLLAVRPLIFMGPLTAERTQLLPMDPEQRRGTPPKADAGLLCRRSTGVDARSSRWEGCSEFCGPCPDSKSK